MTSVLLKRNTVPVPREDLTTCVAVIVSICVLIQGSYVVLFVRRDVGVLRVTWMWMESVFPKLFTVQLGVKQKSYKNRQ